MKQGFLILTFLLFVSTNVYCQFSESDITITTKGLSEEYASRFKEKVNVFTEALNQLRDFPSSIKPIKMDVIYENGEGCVLVTINYNHNKIFSENSSYTRLTRQGFSKGISIYLQYQIFTALTSFKKSVATKGYRTDKDLLKFESAIKLKNQNGDWMNFYAYNYLDSRGFYPFTIYKNVDMQISGKTYETENTKILSDMKYFAVGKTTGLDGRKTGAYYFCKFFNIEMESENHSLNQTNERINLTSFKLSAIPDSLHGCSCLYSDSKNNYNSEKYLYFNDMGRNCMISINNRLMFLSQVEEYIYENDSYKVLIEGKQILSSKGEGSEISATLVIVDRNNGDKITKKIYGNCGC